MFPDIAYLDWIEGRPEQAVYDLGSSDLRRAPAEPGAIAPPALADLPSPPPDVTLESQIADVYGVEPSNVLVTAGATHANFVAAATALRLGADAEPDVADADAAAENGSQRVLVEKPGYEPLLATPRGLGATVDRFRRPAAHDYPLDPDRVAGALVEDTACVTVTNRHNPSGRRAVRETLRECATAAAEFDARLLVDEVYAPMASEPVAGAVDEPVDEPFGGPTAAGIESAVVTSSLTKFFGFGEVRLGWLVADEAFVEQARSVAHHVPAVAEPSRRLARRALANAESLAAGSRERVRTNHDLLASFVRERDDLVGTVEPGCPYAFVAHESVVSEGDDETETVAGGPGDDEGIDGDEISAAAWEQDLLVVPGRFFDDSSHVRVSAGLEPDAVRAALDRFGTVLDDLR